MTQMSDENLSGKEKLSACLTLEEILVQAIEFERVARDFYTELAPKVSKRIRALVEELAEEEQQHYDLFTHLLEDPLAAEQVRQVIQTPVSNKRFSDCIHLPELDENPDDQSILQYALGREQAAMEQYNELSETTPEGPIKDVFVYLAREETKHKNELEKIYYEVVHSGGV